MRSAQDPRHIQECTLLEDLKLSFLQQELHGARGEVLLENAHRDNARYHGKEMQPKKSEALPC